MSQPRRLSKLTGGPEPSPHSSHETVLVGFYGANNLGDELLCATYIKWLEQAGSRVTIVSFNPKVTGENFPGRSTVYCRDLEGIAKSVSLADLVVMGGGGIFQDYDAGLTPLDMFRYPARGVGIYAQICLIARQFGVPLALLGMGVGPLRSNAARQVVRDIFAGASLISLRDDESAACLRECGLEGPFDIACDTIFAAPFFSDPEFSEAVEMRPEGQHGRKAVTTIGLSLRHWDNGFCWEEELTEALAEWLAVNQGVNVRFIAVTPNVADMRTAERVAEKLPPEQVTFETAQIGGDGWINAFSGLDALMAMRLHALIIGAFRKIGLAALSYDRKVAACARQLGLKQNLVLDLWRAPPARGQFYQILNDLSVANVDGRSEDHLPVLAEQASMHRCKTYQAVKISDVYRRPDTWGADHFPWIAAWNAQMSKP